MDADARIRAYYAALEAGDALAPFFASDDTVVKFGISERLTGGAEVEQGLHEQTERTTDWRVDSRALRTTSRSCHAWFSDDVGLAWRDTVTGETHRFETRWSGTLEARTDADDPDEDGTPVFVGMHVSTARSF